MRRMVAVGCVGGTTGLRKERKQHPCTQLRVSQGSDAAKRRRANSTVGLCRIKQTFPGQNIVPTLAIGYMHLNLIPVTIYQFAPLQPPSVGVLAPNHPARTTGVSVHACLAFISWTCCDASPCTGYGLRVLVNMAWIVSVILPRDILTPRIEKERENKLFFFSGRVQS